MSDWNPYLSDTPDQPRLDAITIDGGVVLRAGDRVRLQPLGRADVFDLALAGKTATIRSIEQDYENRVHVAVTVDDDPGSDLGVTGKPGHRFFFSVEEIHPLAAGKEQAP